MRRDIAVIIIPGLQSVGRLGGHDVDAGLKRAHSLQHREGGRHILVEFARNIERPLPDFARVAVLELLQTIGRELRQEIAGANDRQQAAVADAQNLHGDFLDIDRNDRNALLADARQHIILAGEMHLLGTVAHVNVIDRRAQKLLADRGRKSLTQGDRIMLAVMQTIDANLLVLIRDRRPVDAGDAHIRGEIDMPAGERFRELEARAR